MCSRLYEMRGMPAQTILRPDALKKGYITEETKLDHLLGLKGKQ